MRDSLWLTVYGQIMDVWKYDVIIMTDGDDENMNNIEDKIDSLGYRSLRLHMDTCELSKKYSLSDTGIFYCVDDNDDSIYDFYSFTDKEGEALKIPEDGVLITEGMSTELDMVPGDEATMANSSADVGYGTIAGVYKYFIGR